MAYLTITNLNNFLVIEHINSELSAPINAFFRAEQLFECSQIHNLTPNIPQNEYFHFLYLRTFTANTYLQLFKKSLNVELLSEPFLFTVICLFISLYSWWQNPQKLQVNFSPTEPQFNEVGLRVHREAGPTDESHRTTRGVLFFVNSVVVILKLHCLTYIISNVLCYCPLIFSQ